MALIEAALKSNGNTKFAAILSHGIFNDPESWAFTVLNINLNANPEAHLVVQSFFDPSWCSVYIGMKTNGPPYLFEMQAAKIL
uniref:Uncharacterized protein n=1 Tax=Panagrolaimus davidi TaxID=227884 RepID=A0A914PV18_9BILA